MPDDNQPKFNDTLATDLPEWRRRTYRYFGQQLDKVFTKNGEVDRAALIRLRVRWLAESLRG